MQNFDTFFDFVLSISIIALFILGIVKYYQLWFLSIIAVIFYPFYPFIYEIICCSVSYVIHICFKSCLHNRLHDSIKKKNSPGLVYHESYNLTLCGLENRHPFDSIKYKRTIQFLKNSNNQHALQLIKNIWVPRKILRADLLKVMSLLYLLKLNYSIIVCKIIELPFYMLPNWLIRWRCLDPMQYATQGSIDASCIAVEKGWAINVGGGYHHAHGKGGSGFCVYPDITLCIHHLRTYHSDKIKKVTIIDLDAHQGNGHERDFVNDSNTFIIDFYNPHIFPHDTYAKQAIRDVGDIHITPYTKPNLYLESVKDVLDKSLEEFTPDFIVYNAGTDCMINDPLGGLCLEPEDIIKRDEIVFEFAFAHKIPILMLLSGGYQKANAQCIANSIINLTTKFNSMIYSQSCKTKKEQIFSK